MPNNSHRVTQVFTPTTPATLTFVEREALNDQLVDAIRTPGKQIIVFGHSGSGKTTLLRNKLNQLTSRTIRSNCTQDTTLDDLLLDAFDQLNPYYSSQHGHSSAHTRTAGLEATYLSVKAQLSQQRATKSTSTELRVLPPQLTAQRLAQFLGAAKAPWIVEDFHKVDEHNKLRFAQMMKVFLDTAADYPEVKIIAIGAVGTARQVVQYDDEMRNRVAEIHVPLMESPELRELIARGEELLNIRFGPRLHRNSN